MPAAVSWQSRCCHVSRPCDNLNDVRPWCACSRSQLLLTGLLGCSLQGPILIVSDSVDAGQNVRIYISDKFPRNADAATPGEPGLRLLPVPFFKPKCHVRNPLKNPSDVTAVAASAKLGVNSAACCPGREPIQLFKQFYIRPLPALSLKACSGSQCLGS